MANVNFPTVVLKYINSLSPTRQWVLRAPASNRATDTQLMATVPSMIRVRSLLKQSKRDTSSNKSQVNHKATESATQNTTKRSRHSHDWMVSWSTYAHWYDSGMPIYWFTSGRTGWAVIESRRPRFIRTSCSIVNTCSCCSGFNETICWTSLWGLTALKTASPV